MEDNAWTKAEANEKLGLACLTGGDCPLGEAGHATLHEPGEADIAARRAILDGFVLKRWGKRCGADCATAWNGAAGTAARLTDPTKCPLAAPDIPGAVSVSGNWRTGR